MNRLWLAPGRRIGRYGPLIALTASLTLVVAVAPSVAPSAAAVAKGAGSTGPAPGETANGVGAPGSRGGPGSGIALSPGKVGGAPPLTTGLQDISHCVSGRTFDPRIAWFAPPCVPGTPGAPYPNNGGGTYQGVSAQSVTVVDYLPNYGPEIDAIAKANGYYLDPSAVEGWNHAMQRWIVKRFVLYGRTINIVTFKSTCSDSPPDPNCFIPEIDRMVSTYKPFIVSWHESVCGACFSELARLQTIVVGGSGWSSRFSNALTPYFYTHLMTSTRMVDAFAEFWCKQLSTVANGSRRVTQAGTQNPAQNFNGQARRLGVIAPNEPDNQYVISEYLQQRLSADCGDTISHQYFYAPDPNTAAQQVQAAISAMDSPQNPATSVLCFCDISAAPFVYGGEDQNAYYPENLIATVVGMDVDSIGQSYMDSGGTPTLACPNPKHGCPFAKAFGLASLGPQEDANNNVAWRMWRDAGEGGALPVSSDLAALDFAPGDVQIASFLQSAGPVLNPQSVQAAALRIGPVGGGRTLQPLLKITAGDWGWMQDVRVVAWDPAKRSPDNGQNGTYVDVYPTRFGLGQMPVEPSGPPLPARG